MKKIILISGKAEHGKTATANILIKLLQEQKQKVIKIPFARYLKLILKDFYGWNGEKTSYWREQLQIVGTDRIRKELKMPTFHCGRVCDDIKVIWNDFDYVIIDDCRFRNELFYTKAVFPNNVISIRVNRKNYKSSLSPEQLEHESETDLDNEKFDYYISAESGLDNLERAVKYEMCDFLHSQDELEIGTDVEVISINNETKAEHLKAYIGKKGYVYNKINIHNTVKYKVMFNEKTHETAYFLRCELKPIDKKKEEKTFFEQYCS